jgi:malonyl-CoA/methylmalonyl-CoA synthetase
MREPPRKPTVEDDVAVVEAGQSHARPHLDAIAAHLARTLCQLLRGPGSTSVASARITYHVPPSFAHTALQRAIWQCGGVAVPLALSHPAPELEYVIRDAESELLVADGPGIAMCRAIAERLNVRFVTVAELLEQGRGIQERASLPAPQPSDPALIIYTSGTTGKPKGVVSTHANIAAQIGALTSAWEWTRNDRILLVLPLHHVHGVINVVGCAMAAGACVEVQAAFDADAAWDAIIDRRLTLFMAVPTIYARMIQAFDAASPERRRAMSDGARALRLMVSGSAALPVQTLERWREITGHTLLERYGMTETGMILSNPLRGERRPGFVGTPLPDVEVRLVDAAGAAVRAGEAGELEVRGPNVFKEYWRRPDATRDAFRDGWFRTGDTAILDSGSYRLLGRSSVDILKSGGYKISALDIEEVLRTHPSIAECAVVGVPDAEWGDRVCAAVEPRTGASLTLEELRAWAKERLAPYKIPRALKCVDALPRNAMGKVVKPEVAKLFAD